MNLPTRLPHDSQADMPPFFSPLLQLERLRVLMVDDNQVLVEFVERLLSPNCEVMAAYDGDSGLQLIRDTRPDLAIIDVAMPGLDGFELLQAIRNDPRIDTVPVIMLSGDSSEDARLQALAGGADDYLVKPFKPRELIGRIGAHVGMVRVRREAYRREVELLQQLGDMREDLHSVLENTNDAIIALDSSLRVISANRAGGLLLNAQPAAVCGKSVLDLVPALLGSDLEASLRRALIDNTTVVLEYHHPDPDRWFGLRCYPARHGITVFGADITDQKQAQDVLRAAHARLEERVEQRTCELVRSQQELRTLYHRLEEVREEERLMLAREVHDQLGQLLSAAKIDIKLLEDDMRRRQPELSRRQAVAELRSAREIIEKAINTVRAIAQELRPPEVDDNGLFGAIRAYAEEFERRTKVACRVRIGIGQYEPVGAHAHALYRVVQEALTNVLRHARANEVLIEISTRGSWHLLRIVDDGVGITRYQGSSAASLGIRGMRERITIAGGHLRIGAIPRRGTMVAARVPGGRSYRQRDAA